MTRVKDIPPGTVFGRLTVVRMLPNVDKDKKALFEVRCSYGNTLTTQGTKLRSGRKKSCGCLGESFPHSDGKAKAFDQARS
ncbi:MAG: hypothetical protein JO314_00140 [Acidobacteria bacterium]|nr:hypothetical protein [Acidobacteriota bacterium]